MAISPAAMVRQPDDLQLPPISRRVPMHARPQSATSSNSETPRADGATGELWSFVGVALAERTRGTSLTAQERPSRHGESERGARSL